MTQNILVSSLDKIPNHTIIETMGIIFFTTISLDDGIRNLKFQAQSRDCNAIINFKLSCAYDDNSCHLYYSLVGEAVKLVKSKGEKEFDKSGCKNESIEIVTEKGKCTREQAIKALKECNWDITEALLAIDFNK